MTEYHDIRIGDALFRELPGLLHDYLEISLELSSPIQKAYPFHPGMEVGQPPLSMFASGAIDTGLDPEEFMLCWTLLVRAALIEDSIGDT